MIMEAMLRQSPLHIRREVAHIALLSEFDIRGMSPLMVRQALLSIRRVIARITSKWLQTFVLGKMRPSMFVHCLSPIRCEITLVATPRFRSINVMRAHVMSQIAFVRSLIIAAATREHRSAGIVTLDVHH